MVNHFKSHLYIFFTIFFTVYGQLIIKWQMGKSGSLPDSTLNKIIFLIKMLCNPWILSCISATFIAGLCWMAAMTKFDLSYAYPFTALSFVMVLILSSVFFQEPITYPKIAGLVLIISGIVVSAQG